MILIKSIFNVDRYLYRDGQWGEKKDAAQFTSIAAAERFCEKLGIGLCEIVNEDDEDNDLN